MEEQQSQFNDAHIGDKDWMIQNLIRFAEAGFGVTVILTTTGGMVSGRIISGEAYGAQLTQQFTAVRDALSGDTALLNLLVEKVEELQPSFSGHDEEGPYFIHLEDVQIAGPKGFVRSKAPWRGRLEHVTGFVLGTLVDD